MIIGASGSGKSSLLQAPACCRRSRAGGANGCALPPIRPEKAPLETVAKAIAAARRQAARTGAPGTSGSASPDAADQIDELLKDLRIGDARSATVLLPIDQFEEVFTVATPTERAAFLQLLAATLDPARDLPLMVVATGRSDVLEGLIAGRRARAPDRDLSAAADAARSRAAAGRGTGRGRRHQCREGAAGAHRARRRERGGAAAARAYAVAALSPRRRRQEAQLAEYEALGDPQRGLNPIQNSVRLVADQAIGGLRPTERELAALRDAFVPHLVRIRLEDGKRVRQAARCPSCRRSSLRLMRALVQARLLRPRAAATTPGPTSSAGGGHARGAVQGLADARSMADRGAGLPHRPRAHQGRARGLGAGAAEDQKRTRCSRGLLADAGARLAGAAIRSASAAAIRRRSAFIAASAEAEDAERARVEAEQARVRRIELRMFQRAVRFFISADGLAGVRLVSGVVDYRRVCIGLVGVVVGHFRYGATFAEGYELTVLSGQIFGVVYVAVLGGILVWYRPRELSTCCWLSSGSRSPLWSAYSVA